VTNWRIAVNAPGIASLLRTGLRTTLHDVEWLPHRGPPVGLVGGIGMAAMAGARRTQSAFPAYLAATDASDLRVRPTTSPSSTASVAEPDREASRTSSRDTCRQRAEPSDRPDRDEWKTTGLSCEQ